MSPTTPKKCHLCGGETRVRFSAFHPGESGRASVRGFHVLDGGLSGRTATGPWSMGILRIRNGTAHRFFSPGERLRRLARRLDMHYYPSDRLHIFSKRPLSNWRLKLASHKSLNPARWPAPDGFRLSNRPHRCPDHAQVSHRTSRIRTGCVSGAICSTLRAAPPQA